MQQHFQAKPRNSHEISLRTPIELFVAKFVRTSAAVFKNQESAAECPSVPDFRLVATVPGA